MRGALTLPIRESPNWARSFWYSSKSAPKRALLNGPHAMHRSLGIMSETTLIRTAPPLRKNTTVPSVLRRTQSVKHATVDRRRITRT